MSQTMRAALLPGIDMPLEIVTRPMPEPAAGEVRVKVQACGVCGSDLFLQHGGFGAGKLPVVPGHEAAGIVDSLGPGVSTLDEGDQVALYYIDADLDGRWSRAGQENVEPGLRRMGVDVDGAFSEYVVRPAHTLLRPPERIPPATLAVLTDAVATPYHAIARARVGHKDTVLVLGVGGIGSGAVQLASHRGAHVTAASRSAGKLGLATSLGADQVVQLDGENHGDAAKLLAGGPPYGFDVVLQCAGSAEWDQLAIQVAAPAGRVVVVGASQEPFSLRSVDLIWRELDVIGSRGFTLNDMRDVIDLYLAGGIAVSHLADHCRPLAEINAALDDLRSGAVLRTVIDPQL